MTYNRFLGSPALKGTSGTGLDQIVGWIASDKGLVGGTTDAGIEGGAGETDRALNRRVANITGSNDVGPICFNG